MADAGVSPSLSGNPARMRIGTDLAPEQRSATDMLTLVEQVLRERGWRQGRVSDRAGRLTLDAAVDEAAARIAPSGRQRMVLAARTRNRLGRAAGVGSLAAWNDAGTRRIEEIAELIAIARFIGA